MILSIPLSLSFGWQTTLTAAASEDRSCYELLNGQEYLQPSTAVDPNQAHFAFAVVSPNRTNSLWKLMRAYPSCFYLCNVQTGQYLMVAANDRAYVVEKHQLTSSSLPAFVFGPYYPNWPASSEAHITNTLKQQLLCVSSEMDPITQQKLIGTSANSPGSEATLGAACRWRLTAQTTCPSDILC
uniref:Uncharacterized protein n=1 Tax=Anopheles maculatus TaxID=74869 RepID=A0A182SYI4_9DIPT